MDDEEAIRRCSAGFWNGWGYRGWSARRRRGGASLFKAALERGSPFSAVLLDLTVPGGAGGKEAVVRLRKIDPSVKTIASSGYSERTDHGRVPAVWI